MAAASGRQPATGGDAARDVYLSPHSDDVCFSLGDLALKRCAGILLTVFPVAIYLAPRPGRGPVPPEEVTRIRMAEDRAFAAACGLEPRFIELAGASFFGHKPFDLSRVAENAQRTEAPLMQSLLGLAPEAGAASRPWLFCPSGIGGHVDHVAVLMAVSRNFDRLQPRYRIGFYEDLYYASNADARSRGLQNLFQALLGRGLKRHAWPLAEGGGAKLQLLQLYPSQFETLPPAIRQFTPASETDAAPHEAIWTAEAAGPA